MARSTARSNGHSQPRGTQRPSQSQPSQSERRNRRNVEEDDEEEDQVNEAEEDEEGQDDAAGDRDKDEDEDGGGGGGGGGGGDIQGEMITRKANALVRLALFNESRRVPLRRDEINKKVLGEDTRSFNHVYSMAQKILQSTFGMELVELTSRAEREREQNTNDEIQDDANATGLKKKAAASGSKSYIIRSSLAAALIDAAGESHDDLIDEETNAQNDDDLRQPDGSIISWSTADQLGGLGLLYVILALILVSGHTLSDPELKKHLTSFRLSLTSTIEFAPHATQKSSTIDTYLTSLVKQGFLDKLKVGPSGATQGKHSRGGDADEEGVSYEWRWGARAQAEVGERAIAEFVSDFMTERLDEEDDDASTQPSRSEKAESRRLKEIMMKDITRAAGGRLNDVTTR